MTTNRTRYPEAIYAVAGAGDLAYRQLLNSLPKVAGLPARFDALRAELPGRVEWLRAELPGRVEQLRSEVVGQLRTPVRVEQLRAEVPAAVNSLVADAVQAYGDLVARGAQVVDGRTPTEAKTKTTSAAPKTATPKATTPKSTTPKPSTPKATTPKATTPKAGTRKTTAKKVAKKAAPAVKTGPAKATRAVKRTAPRKG